MNEDNEHEEEEEEEEEEEVRDESDNEGEHGKVHTYLPGTCQPLYPVDVRMALSSERHASEGRGLVDSDGAEVIELAVLFVDAMVVFPGNTVPVRLRSRKWVEYLGQRIRLAQECRLQTDEELYIGVMTNNDNDNESHAEEIGTLSIITHTHGSEVRSNEELVVTALGFKRFKVLSRVSSSSCTTDIPIFRVAVLPHEDLMPPAHLRRSFKRPLVKCTGVLGALCPISDIVWRQFWPWRYMALLSDIIDSSTLYRGLRPLIHTHKCPLAFSYFLAANLPLSLEEKLALLRAPNTICRLRSIYTKLKKSVQQLHHLFLRCSTCALPIAHFKAVLTVPGAEGTTGAYVNEYGIMHQTITVSSVNPNYIRYEGSPQTKQSWFPGYSWTIAFCRLCQSHLGWKFSLDSPLLYDKAGSKHYCLGEFWGFTASAVTSEETPLTLPFINSAMVPASHSSHAATSDAESEQNEEQSVS